MAYVITDGCVSCGTCAGECPVGAISEGDGCLSNWRYRRLIIKLHKKMSRSECFVASFFDMPNNKKQQNVCADRY